MEDPLTPVPLTVYTESQLYRYLERIEYPNPNVLPPPTYATLQKLMIYHLAKVPFEDLVIHYSPHHSVSLDPQHLYHKIVERRHGGYCMENNGLFSIILRSLGFSLWTTGGKVSNTVDNNADRSGGFTGWNHMVIIVSIEAVSYHVDVAFGNGAISPIPLIHEEVSPGTGTQQLRLLRQPLKHQGNRDLPSWILQIKDTSKDPWLDLYGFYPNIEFSREDYEVMSYSTSTRDNVIFTRMIMCVRAILSSELTKNELARAGEGGDGKVKIVGRMILTKGTVKRRLGDESEKLEEFETEAQRVAAFKKYFGIELTVEEQEGIRGRSTEII